MPLLRLPRATARLKKNTFSKRAPLFFPESVNVWKMNSFLELSEITLLVCSRDSGSKLGALRSVGFIVLRSLSERLEQATMLPT